MPDDFIAQEQKMAIRALMNCCREVRQVVEQDTNIKPLIQKRPLTSVAVAAAGGLATAYLLTPPRHRRREDGPPGDMGTDRTASEHPSFLVMLERELAHAVVPVLRTFAVSVAGMMFSRVPQGNADGRPPDQLQPDSPAQPRTQL